MGKSKSIKHICFIVPGYPTNDKPYKFTFIDKLVSEVADQGIKCTVISPRGYLFNNPPKRWFKKTEKGNKIDIHCPRYPFFFAKNIGKFNTGLITMKFFEKSVYHVLRKHNIKADCLYAHFIFPAGVSAAKIGMKMNIPTFFAYGESSPWGIEIVGPNRLFKVFEKVNGVIAVSNAKKNELLGFNIISENKIAVFPNAIDPNKFYPRNTEEIRKKYNLPLNLFIVGYTGRFNESKGVMRLVKSLKDNQEIKLVLIGGGKLVPQADNILFQGQVPHDEVPLLLSACDAFVLPTLNEGCSNAIIEAMACGLPIISSDKEFNYDILSHDNAILIDPHNVQEINVAILKLKNNLKLRSKLSERSLLTADSLTLNKRVKNIISWMESRL